MSTAIAIFAKTIGVSPVKTRLAKDIGKDMAEDFYRLSVDAIEELLVTLKTQLGDEVVPYWAVAEENAASDSRWKSFETIWTGEGDLGERLFNISDKLLKKHDKIIIIGTDSPQLVSETILKAIDLLNKNPKNCVIGPAYDGGFYLFGCSNLVSKEIWTNVIYSKNDTLEQLLGELEHKNINHSFIKEMGDVDELEDLKSLYESLCSIRCNQTLSQKRLIKWLDFINIKV